MKPSSLALACLCAAVPFASAQTGWPSRPVRIVVVFPAGSPGAVIRRVGVYPD